MKKILLLLFLAIGALTALIFLGNIKSQKNSVNIAPQNESGDYKNIAYYFNGTAVALLNGHAQTYSDNSAVITDYFGNEARADFNNDTYNDIAFLLTQKTSGSATFYYLAAAFGGKNGYLGSNAVFLGDRIAPQTTEYRDSEIVVNFAERNANEPMTALPTVGVSKYFKTENNMLVEINKESIPAAAEKYSALLLGSWQRVENADSVVVYKSDFSADSFLNGKLIANFKWAVVQDFPAEKFSYKPKQDDLFIKEFDPAGRDRYYLIEKIDSQSIKIKYLATSAELNYIKIK